MPFSFCSMTWVTVSCTVWAEAPGYTALMAIWGGAMGGYWDTGSFLIDSRPASMTMMAITQAKMGRLMKKLGMERLLGIWSDLSDFSSVSDKSDWSDWSDYFLAVACAAAGALPKGTALTCVPG